jgi:hypothetical protein
MDLMVNMSEGNPGSLMFCMELFKMGSRGVVALINLDDVGLYGEKLYMLWNDCCGRDASKVVRVVEARNFGKLSDQDIRDHVAGGYGKPFADDELAVEDGKEDGE